MIYLVNRDRKIYDLEYRVADIISEYQTTGEVHISTNSEGISLHRADFYKVLDYVSDKFNIDKSKVYIHTVNILETHDKYNIISLPSNWWSEVRPHIDKFYTLTKKQSELKTLCSFMGRVNWHRLIMASWLYNRYQDQCLISFNYNHTDVDKVCSDLTEINFYQSDALEESVLFLKNCPLIVDDLYYNKVVPYDEQWLNYLNPLTYYDRVFLDLVSETYIMGDTFFATEKTLRPIIAKTPFITVGPKNYLANLRQMGFKTFSRWWDESYDFCEGPLRILEIKKVITEIMLWPQERLQQTLQEMESVLEHNRTHYLNGIKYDQK